MLVSNAYKQKKLWFLNLILKQGLQEGQIWILGLSKRHKQATQAWGDNRNEYIAVRKNNPML